MNFFEIRSRLEALECFRHTYAEYLTFTDRESNPAAQIVRARLEPSTVLVVDSLRRARLGGLITKDAPSRGGRTVRVNLIRAIFRDEVMQRYGLDERAPLQVLDRAILAYRRRLWRESLQLANPLFWFATATTWIASTPLTFLERAGFDVDSLRSAPVWRGYLLVAQITLFTLVVWRTGLASWIWLDILALPSLPVLLQR